MRQIFDDSVVLQTVWANARERLEDLEESVVADGKEDEEEDDDDADYIPGGVRKSSTGSGHHFGYHHGHKRHKTVDYRDKDDEDEDDAGSDDDEESDSRSKQHVHQQARPPCPPITEDSVDDDPMGNSETKDGPPEDG